MCSDGVVILGNNASDGLLALLIAEAVKKNKKIIDFGEDNIAHDSIIRISGEQTTNLSLLVEKLENNIM